MKYPNIRKCKLSHTIIAKAFRYKNVNSFRGSTAHKTMMDGIETILGLVIEMKAKTFKSAIPYFDEITGSPTFDDAYETVEKELNKL